ncbi:hypothetical protein AX282_21410 [Bacillus spizizenii]|uniref:hypothetical protein n=1 Tax=Bacillus spizizenii TaxID=96241 RepID=UPI000772BAC6|nr:hypothetical protein [Bacillus spizizenii]KXJ35720.1 hypothetical protein AX282_21410 [Bacillus spizizenii]
MKGAALFKFLSISLKKLLHYYLQGGILLFVAAKQGDNEKRTSKKVIDFTESTSYNNKVA